MNIGKLPWIRMGILAAVVLWGYREFTREPIVYEDMSVTQAYAGADTLNGHHLRITGVPSTSNYFFGGDGGGPFQISDGDGISLVLQGEGDDYLVCYSGECANHEETYSQAQAFFDHHSGQGNEIVLEGEMKKDHFRFRLPRNLEDMLLIPSSDK